jgi:uncharacterized membrane protein YadS
VQQPADATPQKDSAGSTPMVGNGLGIVIACVTLPPLIYFGNPAFALLVGGAIVLVIDRGLFSQASTFSRYCLQTAIVLLGFRLSLDTLWSLSADYTWTVAAYVLVTLGLGLLIGRGLRSSRRGRPSAAARRSPR